MPILTDFFRILMRETPPREALASLGGVVVSVVWALVGGV